MSRFTLQEIIERLQAHYGPPPPPMLIDPWLWVLWENVAYLADDARRLAAFNALRNGVGTSPKAIRAATSRQLEAVTGYGILPAQFAAKLKDCAEIALKEFPDGLASTLSLPRKDALRALMKFPGIGKPGAEKILLFCRAQKVLALESNGLRVLVRLGFAVEQKNYATTHRLVQDAAAAELRDDFDWLIAAHELLRRHGQGLCRRSQPQCDKCPLSERCDRVGVSAGH